MSRNMRGFNPLKNPFTVAFVIILWIVYVGYQDWGSGVFFGVLLNVYVLGSCLHKDSKWFRD